MISTALRKIEAEIEKLIREPDLATPEALLHIKRQIGAQAEMLELGLATETETGAR